MFNGKTVLLTGGTGSFGTTFIERFMESDIKKIIIFSRDEKKQDDMRITYRSPKLKYILGNIQDTLAIEDACRNVDYIFHAAALKQVPSCDFSPIEAAKTNIMGTNNLLHAAIKNQVKKVTFLSTGKAVKPINAMGISKAMMEKVILQKARDLLEDDEPSPIFTMIRYSNVFASRGSAVNLFINQIKNKQAITLTHPDMMRSFMSKNEALDLALFAMKHGENGDLFIYKSKKASLHFVATTLQKLLNAQNTEIKIIGKRHGEKLQETILSEDELLRVSDMGDYCKVHADRRGLNYYHDSDFNRRASDTQEASKNSYTLIFPKLSISDMKEMLDSLEIHH